MKNCLDLLAPCSGCSKYSPNAFPSSYKQMSTGQGWKLQIQKYIWSLLTLALKQNNMYGTDVLAPTVYMFFTTCEIRKDSTFIVWTEDQIAARISGHTGNVNVFYFQTARKNRYQTIQNEQQCMKSVARTSTTIVTTLSISELQFFFDLKLLSQGVNCNSAVFRDREIQLLAPVGGKVAEKCIRRKFQPLIQKHMQIYTQRIFA